MESREPDTDLESALESARASLGMGGFEACDSLLQQADDLLGIIDEILHDLSDSSDQYTISQ